MNKMYDRFNLEDEIQNVWNTENDIDTILYRMLDARDGEPTMDEIANMLEGLKELHKSRSMKLFDVFESLVESGKIDN